MQTFNVWHQEARRHIVSPIFSPNPFLKISTQRKVHVTGKLRICANCRWRSRWLTRRKQRLTLTSERTCDVRAGCCRRCVTRMWSVYSKSCRLTTATISSPNCARYDVTAWCKQTTYLMRTRRVLLSPGWRLDGPDLCAEALGRSDGATIHTTDNLCDRVPPQIRNTAQVT